MLRIFALVGLSLIYSCMSWKKQDYLLRVQTDNGCGYVRPDRSFSIAPRFQMCFTDTFRTLAVVTDPDLGLIGINRGEEVLFEVFAYDNGPDPVSEGLFRIIIDGKIGYANETGKIVITPQFPCAWPFENGRAKVALDCERIFEGEHSRWESTEWFFIDKTGKRIQ